MSNLTDLLNEGWNILPEDSGGKNEAFVLIPKWKGLFYDDIALGCQEAASESNVSCIYLGSDAADVQGQAALIKDVVINPTEYNITKVLGIGVAVLDEEVTGSAIDFATSQNIPVVTFDSDAPSSSRIAYVGTNNSAFGEELGKVMKQVDPTGGQYRIITGIGPNLDLRVQGVRNALRNSKWVEETPPLYCNDNGTLAIEQMHGIASDPLIRGIIPVGGWPMFETQAFKQFAKLHNNRLTYVVADATSPQMNLMNQGYVDGLVGQLPFVVGRITLDILLDITRGIEPPKDNYATHFLEILSVPLRLPDVQMTYNSLGGLVVLGYTLFSVIALLSLIFLCWTYVYRNARTIRASQPVFMAMLCVGSLIMASAMISLSIEDRRNYSQKGTDIACMSIPWLLSIGFCTMFSALFTKTWRIVRIMHNSERFRRVKITAKQVLYPYVILLIANVIILTCWTVINPLVYRRVEHKNSTDLWNRVNESAGRCVSSNPEDSGGAAPYLGSLAVINGGLLLTANIMAYRSRHIRTEFRESHYIAIVMASMLQAFLIGVPIIWFVLGQPMAYYVVMVFLDFAVCVATMLFMFVPKVLAHRDHVKAQKRSQTRLNASDDSGEEGLRVRRIGGSIRFSLPHHSPPTSHSPPPSKGNE
jgi:ABC-type sugar transport system substrate-binding protein